VFGRRACSGRSITLLGHSSCGSILGMRAAPCHVMTADGSKATKSFDTETRKSKKHSGRRNREHLRKKGDMTTKEYTPTAVRQITAETRNGVNRTVHPLKTPTFHSPPTAWSIYGFQPPPQHTLTLKMVTAMYVETLIYISTRRINECRVHTNKHTAFKKNNVILREIAGRSSTV
jgi:hypothetical protein